ncbi:MAG TPA: glycosyltransferase family 4 protein [Terriglobia bacterium]|nr:glycosyltransferase family 4 protein [Terriglobia bacterium]
MSPDTPFSIAHIDTGLELRGGQRQLLLLAHGLRKRGHSQLIVCAEAGELCDRAKADGFPVLALPQDDFKHIQGIRRLRRRIRRDALMLLHAHDGVGQTVSWLASCGTAARRIATRRVTYLPKRRIDYRLKYSYTCHAVIAVSQFIGRVLGEAGIPQAMIHVIPDGIEIPERVPDGASRQTARARWRLTENEFLIGNLSGISPEKGQDLALEALEILAGRMPNAKLALGGKIAAADLATSNLAAAAARGQVVLAGYRDNLFEFFSALDVYIMPSRSEGLGSAALMAMAHALPVIATRVGGLPEIVEDGITGWLVAPESPDSLAQAIAVAAANPTRLKELGNKARLRSKEFSADIMVERTEALYRRLMGSGQPQDAITSKELRANG